MIPQLPAPDAAVNGPEFSHEMVSLRPGRYLFKGILGPGRDGKPGKYRWPPGEYALIGVAHHVHTFQEQVVYQGQDGRLWVTTVEDWQRNFEPVSVEAALALEAEPLVEAVVPERVAGKKVAGVLHAPDPDLVADVQHGRLGGHKS